MKSHQIISSYLNQEDPPALMFFYIGKMLHHLQNSSHLLIPYVLDYQQQILQSNNTIYPCPSFLAEKCFLNGYF